MLRLFYPYQVPKDASVILDVEAAFTNLKTLPTTLNKKLMQEIEGAQYVSPLEFIDRFGRTLHIVYLSTGCKASIVVAQNSDKVVSIRECGINARDAIIRNITEGNIIFDFNGVTIDYPGFDDFAIDVELDGRHFTSLDDFNLYLTQGM